MGWCPSCKNEFVEGITVCPKCEIPLVDSLEEAKKQGEILKALEEEKQYSRKPENDSEESSGNSYTMSSMNNMSAEAVASASSESYKSGSDEVTTEEAQKEAQLRRAQAVRRSGQPVVYQDKNVAAQDVKGSAFSLILVGGVGMVFVALVLLDVIKLNQNPISKMMFCAAMAILFVVLIVMGFASMKTFKILQKTASEEDQLSAQIEKWYKEKLTAELIDRAVSKYVSDDEIEEEKYFYRYSCIRSILVENFVNLDNLYADHIVEEIYAYLYES